VSTSIPTTSAGQQAPEVRAPRPAPEARAPEAGTTPAVVVGVDGSECALEAVRWAAHEAARRSAPLRIVHAAPYLGRPPAEGGRPPELPRARRITAQAFTVARRTEREVPADTEIDPDEPVAALLRAASGGQLLVLGIATTGAADELVLAPVAQRVVARSPQPVVVVPRRRGGDPAGRPVVVVVGLGDPADDEPVLEFAAAAARRSGLPLAVLSTKPVPGELESWSERFPDVELVVTELPGAPGHRLLGEACPAPLLVLPEGRGSRLHRHPDSAHRWLLRHCTSPMALVPPAQQAEGTARES
jgi:nucleotide-binding universal stress UspA family protein